jgi:hypothetical protein
LDKARRSLIEAVIGSPHRGRMSPAPAMLMATPVPASHGSVPDGPNLAAGLGRGDARRESRPRLRDTVRQPLDVRPRRTKRLRHQVAATGDRAIRFDPLTLSATHPNSW